MAKSNWKSIFSFIAFLAVAFVGVALFLSALGILGGAAGALQTIAQILSYVVVAFYSFAYAYGKSDRKHPWYLIIWAIAVVLIVLAYII
jgi:TM2 domain-containing membrane protein YozV